MNMHDLLRTSEKFKINLGLDRMKNILNAFDNPQDKVKFIHVAGTNGKGSTCAIIEKILLEYGKFKVGKYISPHLFSYTERFSISGKNIGEDELNELILEINKKDKWGLSEFEILTTACFLYFARNNVDIGILETGLGGKLDATNVIENPLISIITSISYDHKEYLGNTIEKIAFEKAGIFKNGCKSLFLKENKGYKALFEAALKTGAVILEDNLKVELSNNFAFINGEKCKFSLNGDFQKENLRLALIAIKEIFPEISFEIIKKALANVRWTFRMDKIKLYNQNLLIDGCHNPDGARVLSEYLQKYESGKRIKFIFGCLANKEYDEILKILYNPDYDFCFFEFNYQNALKFENINNFNMRKILNPVNEIKKGDFDLCVLAGSLYMLGEIFKDLL